MSRRRILLVGGTGLIGGEVVRLAARVPEIALIGLARREMVMPRGARFELLVADPAHWDEAVAAISPDVVINALGTTRMKAGGNEALRAVDHDLVMRVARAAKAAGADQFVHVSAVGAHISSRNFYLRTKGETERDLSKLRFRRLDILRPGLLKGQRENDLRLGESAAMVLSPLGDLLLWGRWKAYRAIPASVVAAALLQASRERVGGAFVFHYEGMYRLRRKLEKD